MRSQLGLMAAVAVGVALAAPANAKLAAQPLDPIEQGYVIYHYTSEFEPRTLLSISGQNCDGGMYHYPADPSMPLMIGSYEEIFYFTC